jgi:serine protease Do
MKIDRRRFTRAVILGAPALCSVTGTGAGSAACTAARRRVPATAPDFAALIERLAPAVVSIAGAAQTLGSGFGVGGNLVVTAAHVAQAAGSPLYVVAASGKHVARVIKVDDHRDLAVLQVEPPLPSIALTPAGSARVGEWVVVLGNPFGAGVTATVGIVSATPGAITTPAQLAERIQINAAVNPGNSGGPVCNLHGEAVGMASALMPGGQGLAFVTPSSTIRALLDSPAK